MICTAEGNIVQLLTPTQSKYIAVKLLHFLWRFQRRQTIAIAMKAHACDAKPYYISNICESRKEVSFMLKSHCQISCCLAI